MAKKNTSKEANTLYLIEWNEETQSIHLNEVVGNVTRHKVNSFGYAPILACKTFDQAVLVANFLEKVIINRLKRHEEISIRNMKFAAKNLAEFSEQILKSMVKEWPLMSIVK